MAGEVCTHHLRGLGVHAKADPIALGEGIGRLKRWLIPL
jgi:hypothetical protein